MTLLTDEIETYHLAYFSYFYSRDEKKIPSVWSSLTNQDATSQIATKLAELREQAFISYVPLKIIEFQTGQVKFVLFLLRDMIILNTLFCQTPQATNQPPWPECSSKLKAMKSTIQGLDVSTLGETTVLIAEQSEAFEYVATAKQVFNKNSYRETRVCCGQLLQFADSEQLGLPHDFLLLYDGEKQPLANQLLIADLPAYDVSITKLEKLILNFQQQRLEMIEKKRGIETLLTDSLESKALKSRNPSERTAFLEKTLHGLSDSYAWLNRASSLVKNSQTVVHAGLDNLSKFKSHIYSSEYLDVKDFLTQHYLTTFEEYEKQLATDYDYLDKTLNSVQDALRTFNSHLDVDRGRLQEIFYRRVIVLFLLVVCLIVSSALFYYLYVNLWSK